MLSCSIWVLLFSAGAAEDTELAKAIMAHQFHPSVLGPECWEGYRFSDLEIRIKESTDLYGAVLWPSVLSHLLSSAASLLFVVSSNLEPPTGDGAVSFPRDKPGQIQLEGQKCDRAGSRNWSGHHRFQPLGY